LKKVIKYIIAIAGVSFISFSAYSIMSGSLTNKPFQKPEYQNVTPPDTNLTYPLPQNPDGSTPDHPFYLDNPSNFKTDVVFDTATNQYIIQPKIGNINQGNPTIMTPEEYNQYDIDKGLQQYWRERASSVSSGISGGLIPQLKIKSEVFESIFGSNVIDIRPSGSAELIFGVIHNRRDDPALDIRQRKTTNFNFDEKIQMSVIAKIGDKIEFKTNYNTQATFEFENKLKLKYEGKEDEIVKLIEAGDVTLPLNSVLIQGSQSLFGIKTSLQFGKTTITSVFSEQKGQSQNISVTGGAQTNQFNFKADQYEENKHFFVSQFFYENYNRYLSNMPLISSPVNITKIEVWRTNIGAATTENRNIIALTDLGEYRPSNPLILPTMGASDYPNNIVNNFLTNPLLDTNKLRSINLVGDYLRVYLGGLTSGVDFEKVESARKLQPSEYSFNSKLGFISLNSALNSDQVLAVAFQYTISGDTTVYQVGEFSNEINPPSNIVTKLLKSSSLNTRSTLWKLMMKNVYSLSAFQVNSEDFRLNILYSGDDGGIPTGFFNEGAQKGIPLIRLMGLDRVNYQGDPTPDGVFDFIDNAATQGGTIQSSNGRIYFPTVEPFGKDLRTLLTDQTLADKYSFDSLYSLTKQQAQQYPDRNKFYLEGMYKSKSGSDISLNAMNVPQGSVKVTAGSIVLVENTDYTVDYTLGRVKIINEGILNSGTPINIALENQSTFNMQTKTMMGMHINQMINKDFNVGATILNLKERPITQKINYGDEPINNTIWGMDISYRTKSRLLTKLLDKLPFYSTKTESNITFDGEFAHFIPGHSSAIGKSGTTYIDDFEGSKSSIDIKSIGSWFLASTPQGQTQAGLWPEAAPASGLVYGYNRAKIAWYIIDPIFYRDNSATPSNITKDDQSTPYAREVLQTEIFPNKENQNNQVTNIAVLNFAYYPNERGPYNFDVAGINGISRGLNADGTLKDPQTRWAGIMRKIESTDFDATNVEYIQFWMMDPFINNPNSSGGKLIFHLGDISEDILRDGRKSFENGLPVNATVQNVDTTIWGRVPTLQSLVNAFDNDPLSRSYQDVGYDGLSDVDERSFFAINYLQLIANNGSLGTGSQAYSNANNDPSSDNYHYFRGTDYDSQDIKILERYKKFNGIEGNSPTDNINPEAYPTMATTLPNIEDINKDNTLSEEERYYQYTLNLDPNNMNIGQNFIADIYTTTVQVPNGSTTTVKWYQVKIPIRDPQKVVGNIQGFNSIRFMRMIAKDFYDPTIFRFATLELVRGEWRKYTKDLLTNGAYIPGGDDQTGFNSSTVNIEENGKRVPIPYVIPPGIEREQMWSQNLYKLNEQSLSLRVSNLLDGDARAVYKTTSFDFRQFGSLKLFTHTEKLKENEALNSGDLTMFIRVGSDFSENYYEYEMPLNVTPWYTSADNAELIWPDSMIIQLSKLVDAKQNRNISIRNGANYTNANPYSEYDGINKITVVGTPNISDVRVIMLGIRNPKKKTLSDHDDMLPKSAEIWINELRLTDFIQNSGWAATARVRATLADLGDVVFAGSTSTPGFGSLEKKINERQKEYITSFDIATNIEAGKFLPKKWNVKIPVHYDYSQIISTPEYNPLNPDTKLQSDLDTYSSVAQRDSIKHLTQDFTERKNINLMNIRKERGAESKPKIYDVENLDLTYAYSEINTRNINIEYDNRKTYRGGIGYNYTANPKNFRPLSTVRFITKHKSLAILRDFNFYIFPKVISFRSEMNRQFNEAKLRNKSVGLVIIEPTYMKTFDWSRTYNVRWDITQALKVEYQATTMARVDEPQGLIDTKDKKDSIIQNIMDAGRINNFNQTASVNYQIPINKIPLFNWVSANARYSSTYSWVAPPISLQRLGNNIENSNTIQFNGTLNMQTLYNKVSYLKKISQEQNNNANKNNPKNSKTAPKNKKPNAKTLDNGTASNDTTVKKTNVLKSILDNTLKVAMMLKNVTFSYTEGNGITLPGFVSSPVYFGNDPTLNSPGWDYVFGAQSDIVSQAQRKQWITKDSLFNSPYLVKYNQNLNIRASVEPIKDLKIEITANRTYTENKSAFIKANDAGDYGIFSPQTTGSFSVTFFALNTAFVSDAKDYSNQNFSNLKAYRITIAERLAGLNSNSTGTDPVTNFPTGYGPTSQDVLIPAFIAAYSGKSPDKVGLTAFPAIPMPNWRLTYNGLTKLKWFKDIFQTFSVSHAYNNNFSVGSYTTNIRYNADKDGLQYVKDALNNFIPQKEIAQVSINEQFSPLLNFDMALKNSLLAKAEIKKSRNIALTFSNGQLTELTSTEYVFGLGYRFKDISLTFNFSGVAKKIKSDLNIKADVSIRENKTILRKLIEGVNQISAGQRVISINLSADYQLSQKFTIRAFYDQVLNTPYVSNQFPNSNINSGISVRFTLAQ
jgi:cell surface protein SprA